MPLRNRQVLQEHYRIDALLGQGGMGAVYRATDLTTGALMALKENLRVTPEAQRQFAREASLLRELRHPNLPRVSDYFVVPGQGQYLVMEFIEGQDLQQILARQGPLPEAQALSWLGHVLEALAHLHSKNIIHRDVKPANIKITPQGRVFLVDFGLAKLYDPLQETTVGARGVTPGFAPPEQYGYGRTDARTDLYSVGATLYALLTGQTPPDALASITGQARLVPPRQLSPTVSPQVEAVVLHAMQARPSDRYQTAAEFLAALGGPHRAPPRPVAPLETPTVIKAAGDPPAEAATAVKPRSAPPAETPPPEEPPSTQPIEAPPPAEPQPRPAREAPVVHVARLPIEPEMLTMPAGPFLMGTSEVQALALAARYDWAVDFGQGLDGPTFAWERPQHEVTLPEYAIARHPVTNADYRAFVEATGYQPPGHWPEGRVPEELADHPVRLVNWYDARTYALWLREQTGKGYRLPTEAEWEKAARGTDGRFWPWGDEWDAARARWRAVAPPVTSPVGGHSPAGDSPCGCTDMAGNVMEWCSSEGRNYPYRAADGREKAWHEKRPARLRRKRLILRGGGWDVSHPGFLRCACRMGAEPGDRFEASGFRLACDP